MLVLLTCWVTLRFIAHASHLDPTWVPGIYDSADYDDVINLITKAVAVREVPLVTANPVFVGFGPVLGSSSSQVSDALLLDFRLRSPPTI